MSVPYKCVSFKRFTSYSEMVNVFFNALEACGWQKVSEPSGVFSVPSENINTSTGAVTYPNHGLTNDDIVVYLGCSNYDGLLSDIAIPFRVDVPDSNTFILKDFETRLPVTLSDYIIGNHWFQKGAYIYRNASSELAPEFYYMFTIVDILDIAEGIHGFYCVCFMNTFSSYAKIFTKRENRISSILLTWLFDPSYDIETRHCFYITPTYFASVSYEFDILRQVWNTYLSWFCGFFPNKFYQELTYITDIPSPTSIVVANPSGFISGKSYHLVSKQFFDVKRSVTISSISGNTFNLADSIAHFLPNDLIGVAPLSHYIIQDFFSDPPVIEHFLDVYQLRDVNTYPERYKIIVPTVQLGPSSSEPMQWLHPFYIVGNDYVYGISDEYVYYCSSSVNNDHGIMCVFVSNKIDEGQCATDNSETILRVSSSRWQQNSLVGKAVAIVSGAGDYQIRKIIANESDYLVVDPPFDVVPSSGDSFIICEKIYRKAGYFAFREGV